MSDWLALVIGFGIGMALVSAPWLIYARNRYSAGKQNTYSDLMVARAEADQLRTRLQQSEQALEAKREETSRLGAEKAELKERLEQQKSQSEEKLKLVEQARINLADAFKALSSEALKSNNEEFLKLAKTSLQHFQESAKEDLGNRQKAIEQLTHPIRERLEKFDTKLNDLERSRVGAYKELSEQVRSLVDVHIPHLHNETANHFKALRQPATRGRWGEVQLRRVVEMAGMTEHCDFEEQVSQTTESGRLRPDLIVHLPGGRHIVVDAKAPIEAYLEAIEAKDDNARKQHLAAHARQVRDHIGKLGNKRYFEQFDPAPEFAVLFVPGEAFFSAALMQDPTLIEHGTDQRVIMASPTTLIALLKAVSYGWRQEAVARNAQEIAKLGKELYDRIGNLAGHWTEVGQRLNQAVNAYDKSVGTLEARVLVSARKFQDLRIGNSEDDLSVNPLGRTTRTITAPEKDEEQ